MSNKITLSIAGFNLIINTSEDEDRVRKLNAQLNSDLQAILSQNPNASVTNAALLCSLDYLDRADKANHSANNLRSQIKDYLSDAAAAKLQLDDQMRKNNDLAAEIQTLRAHLTKLATEGAAGSAAESSLRRELDAARSESSSLRSQLRDQLEQNKAVADKAHAMNEYIAGQDKELKRLGELCQQQADLLEEQTRRLFSYEQQGSSFADEQNALRERAEQAEHRAETAADALQSLRQEYDDVCVQLEQSLTQREELLGRLAALQAQTEASAAQQAAEPPETDYAPAYEQADALPEEENAPLFRDLSDFPTIELEQEEPAQEYIVHEPLAPVSFDFSVPEEDPAAEPACPADAAEAEFEDDGELGVGEGFKTFGQMIAEELGRGKESQLVTPFGAAPVATTPTPSPEYSVEDEDDDLPNLSWINDID